ALARADDPRIGVDGRTEVARAVELGVRRGAAGKRDCRCQQREGVSATHGVLLEKKDGACFLRGLGAQRGGGLGASASKSPSSWTKKAIIISTIPGKMVTHH